MIVGECSTESYRTRSRTGQNPVVQKINEQTIGELGVSIEDKNKGIDHKDIKNTSSANKIGFSKWKIVEKIKQKT